MGNLLLAIWRDVLGRLRKSGVWEASVLPLNYARSLFIRCRETPLPYRTAALATPRSFLLVAYAK